MGRGALHPVPVVSRSSEWTAEVTLYQWIVAGILVLTSLLLIMSVLLHKGKGGGLSDMFGGGVSGGLSGSSVVERNLDRISVVLSIIWIGCIVALSLMYKHSI
ncbi:MAG: preprotein translocase subunit SecG [Catenulispora sp.]|nr:preprotein translocase subunit SecG [Catenulispora sp.]